MTHDRGFAPNIKYGICTLSGCKNDKSGRKKNIEESATKGSWVIGIGGKNTGKSNKLIYAMEVEENLGYLQFQERFPKKGKYLLPEDAGTNVLISRKFYYFGDNAIDLPENLKCIVYNGRNCKLVSDGNISKLEKYLGERYSYGTWGNPCNSKNHKKCSKC